MFSDWNNLKSHTILCNNYETTFGFTYEAVETLLVYYKLSHHLDGVQYWYNGYNIGTVKIYNPWSIMNFIENKKFAHYWIGTSENKLVNDLIRSASGDILN